MTISLPAASSLVRSQMKDLIKEMYKCSLLHATLRDGSKRSQIKLMMIKPLNPIHKYSQQTRYIAAW